MSDDQRYDTIEVIPYTDPVTGEIRYLPAPRSRGGLQPPPSLWDQALSNFNAINPVVQYNLHAPPDWPHFGLTPPPPAWTPPAFDPSQWSGADQSVDYFLDPNTGRLYPVPHTDIHPLNPPQPQPYGPDPSELLPESALPPGLGRPRGRGWA